MPTSWLVCAHRFIWNITFTALYAVVDADLAHGTERFVVERRDTERGAQFLVEPSQVGKVLRERGQLEAFVGQQKFLVSGVPKPGKPPLQHNRRHNRHLVEVVRLLAEFRSASVFFHADNTARAADGEAQRRQAFNLLRCKSFFDIPHGALSVVNAESSVKRTAITAKRSAAQNMDTEGLSTRLGKNDFIVLAQFLWKMAFPRLRDEHGRIHELLLLINFVALREQLGDSHSAIAHEVALKVLGQQWIVFSSCRGFQNVLLVVV